MPHLYAFRQGWESEHLARFILSKFSFISQPSTIADDIGSDFFCTLFRKETIEHRDYLLPANFFAIQIKSCKDEINLSDKARYLEQIEMPYFVGVVDKDDLNLKIYSGRALDLLFAMKGVPNKMIVELTPPINDKKYYEKIVSDHENKAYKIKFPFIAELSANAENNIIQDVSLKMAEQCSRIHRNIASRRQGEFILSFSESDVRIFAGPGSATKFRFNFYKRLAEVFYNFEWLYNNDGNNFSETEFQKFVKFWETIKQEQTVDSASKSLVDGVYNNIKQLMNKSQNGLNH